MLLISVLPGEGLQPSAAVSLMCTSPFCGFVAACWAGRRRAVVPLLCTGATQQHDGALEHLRVHATSY